MPACVRNFALVLLSIGLMTACSSTEDKEPVENQTEKNLYDLAQRQLRTSQWDNAIKNLQALEENFPFGNYAEQAQLELIYAHHSSGESDAAIAAADRFIRLHPQHRNVDYAYYMKGLASFTDGNGLFQRFIPIDITQRDPGSARESFGYFAQFLARFPESQYAPDAKKRMIYLRNLLARYEIHVANYYFKREAYIAAASRGRYVVENFPKTPAVPDALAVMVQAYHLLGKDKLAEDALTVLKDNYPEYPALKGGEFNYNYGASDNTRSWISRATFGLFDKLDPPGFDTRQIYNARHKNTPD